MDDAPTTQPPRRSGRFTTRRLVITAALIGAVGVGVIQLVTRSPQPEAPDPAQSKRGTFRIHGARPNMTITRNGQLAGSYPHAAGRMLFYVLALPNKQIVASGNMLVDARGNFSRNLADGRRIRPGQALTLTVFTQNREGRRTDELSLPVTYQ